ncbi:glycoside hydrolase family 1 protein [Oidiodendron maius Zn]|uniref:beta-glucosidase n=1 Tax=Oidiodendron maius (strain Zn) TaxID=913774 RepID=A0A0C3GCD5_OIDMZ|nr:glycoside hydrolase family 1 protein [Oidiodendron maius Zn]
MPTSQPLPLPVGFEWGYATAAYQIEGAVDIDGRAPSIWDTFSHLFPTRTRGANGDVACDHYNKYKSDIDLLASYGAKHYRFSISWSRIIPLGGRNDPINELGPWVTLYHWDLPQKLEDRYGGWLSLEEIQKDFNRYATVCFERFGDRVKRWITFNEPAIISIFGYSTGTVAPGRSSTNNASLGVGDSSTEPWLVGKSIIMSHALATRTYRQKFRKRQSGQISIVLNGYYYEPWDKDSPEDMKAAQRRLEFYIGWFADPVFLAQDYPASMRAQLGSRLPQFTPEEFSLLKEAKSDWYGMNHYTAKFARANPDPPSITDFTGNVTELKENKSGLEIGPVSGVSWLQVCPQQFRKLLVWVSSRYNIKIYVTENGCPCPGENEMSVEDAIVDDFRVKYFQLYLDAISKAIYEDGVDVGGYFAWSLMDNFEWQNGYDVRFGVTHVDYETLQRTPKSSAAYLRSTFDERMSIAQKLTRS